MLTIAMSLRVRRDTRFRPALYAPIAAAVIFLGLFRLVDTLVPMVFNRPFNLYLDTQRLPDVVFLGWTHVGATDVIDPSAQNALEIIREKKILTEQQIAELLDPIKLTNLDPKLYEKK